MENEYPLNYEQVIRQDFDRYLDLFHKIIREREIDTLIIHHSAGNRMVNASYLEVFSAINQLHYEKFYKGRYSSNRFSRFTTSESYCLYHFLIWPYNMPAQGKKWNIMPTHWYVEHHSVGGTKKDEYNNRSIQVCILGDYTKLAYDKTIEKVFIEYFDYLFKKCKAKKINMNILGHKEVEPTACPGKLMSLVETCRKYYLSL